MMCFTYIFRDKSGAKCEATIEAASREMAFATLKANGISPLSIREGRKVPCNNKGGTELGRRNKSSNGIKISNGGRSKKLVVGLFVSIVAIATTVYFWLLRTPVIVSDSRDPSRPSAMPKEVKPSVPIRSKALPHQSPQHIANVDVNGSGSMPASATSVSLTTNRVPEELLDRRPIKRPFKTGIKQVMSLMFTTRLGAMPFPLPRLSDEEVSKIWEILNKEVPVTEEDSDDSALCKETVAAVKKEMADFLKQGGGTPRDFLQYYQKILVDAHREYMIASEECEKVREEHPEIFDEFLKKVNKRLQDKGIRQVIPDPPDDDNDITPEQQKLKER